MVDVGVVAVQGDVEEHLAACRTALDAEGLSGDAVPVRRPADLDGIDGLVVPGGESTTIGRRLADHDLLEPIRRRGREGSLPVMGTCAGCILMADAGDAQVEATETPLLGLMEMAVERNAFGRQRESFQATVDLEGIGAFPAVFIRAPAIEATWGGCRPLGHVDDRIVMAEQAPHVALAFHPELTGDARVHRRFVERL